MNPRFLDIAQVLEIHKSCIDLYGGAHGIRDIGLLESALAQPLAGFGGSIFMLIYSKWRRPICSICLEIIHL
jgi:death-on-curing protein